MISMMQDSTNSNSCHPKQPSSTMTNDGKEPIASPKVVLALTPSADDILGVSPTSSFVTASNQNENETTRNATSGGNEEPAGSNNMFRNRSNSNFLSSSSSSCSSENGEVEADVNGEDLAVSSAYSASGSESEDAGSEAGSDRGGGGDGGGESSKFAKNATQSEFDKALMTGDGVPNTGSASFDPYLLKAESSLVDEVMSVSGAEDDPTLTQQPPQSQSQTLNIPTRKKAELAAHPPPPPPPPPSSISSSSAVPRSRDRSSSGHTSVASTSVSSTRGDRPKSASSSSSMASAPHHSAEDVSDGVLPDVLMTMRQKIESLTLFDSDMIKIAEGNADQFDEESAAQERESLRRSFQQSISAAVLVSLAHKRYERRRLAAMEIEKVVRSLVQSNELDRVRAILLLLSDDYVRSVSEDARKGGVVALAACAIGLKRAEDSKAVLECRDLILASVVHACQDHSQRVRYYATESLFNVVKVIPPIAVQHFFILFEILRSLYADVDPDVRSGAELLDKKLKEVIVGAINSGSFTADACVPIFARFVYMRNKATKQLTLTWLHELSEKLIGAPILEFLHLFLGGIFAMVADPNVAIRQSALAFLQSVLPKLLVNNKAFEDEGASMKVDFDKILQSLVTTMEHPDPFVRKVAMYWMSRIVKAHMGDPSDKKTGIDGEGSFPQTTHLTAASISVRNSLPHVLPGILLSIGDTFQKGNSSKDSFLPDQTTRSLAEQTNACLQNAVRRDGSAYVTHLDGFIVALREELDSPGGLSARNPPAIERKPYRMDVKQDGSGIESTGWFRASNDVDDSGDSMMMSRLCALEWVVVLYESVVPDVLKAEYAREFITPIIHQLVDNPPEQIIFKSLEVLAKITVPVEGESALSRESSVGSLSGWKSVEKTPQWESSESLGHSAKFPMTDSNAAFALDILDVDRRQFKSRDREVFSALIRLHSFNHQLVSDLSRVVQFMCTLQPPEFVFVSFALELDRYVILKTGDKAEEKRALHDESKASDEDRSLSKDLEFVSSFVKQMNYVLLNLKETSELRDALRDCIGSKGEGERDDRRALLFHIILHSFSHNVAAATALCLWGGAFRTASTLLYNLDPLDANLMFFLELDQLVELLERPLFRHLHLRMLECDSDSRREGSGAMLFKALKLLLMIIPESTCYNVLRDRLVTVSRFRQSALAVSQDTKESEVLGETKLFVARISSVRALHCDAKWQTIRADSLEKTRRLDQDAANHEEGSDRRKWLGYKDAIEEAIGKDEFAREKSKQQRNQNSIEEVDDNYRDLETLEATKVKQFSTDETDPGRQSSGGEQESKKDVAPKSNELNAESCSSKPQTEIADQPMDEDDEEEAENWKGFWGADS